MWVSVYIGSGETVSSTKDGIAKQFTRVESRELLILFVYWY